MLVVIVAAATIVAVGSVLVLQAMQPLEPKVSVKCRFCKKETQLPYLPDRPFHCNYCGRSFWFDKLTDEYFTLPPKRAASPHSNASAKQTGQPSLRWALGKGEP